MSLPKKFTVRMASDCIDTPCWVWDGFCDSKGYGTTQTWRNGRRGPGRVHRIMYEHYVGSIPEGLYLDHLCRVRNCCNPSHLEAVTPRVNTQRGLSGAAMRERTHCKNGHEYTYSNTSWYEERTGTMTRCCLQCKRDAYVRAKDNDRERQRMYRRRADAKRNTPEFRAKKAAWARGYRAQQKLQQ